VRGSEGSEGSEEIPMHMIRVWAELSDDMFEAYQA
jgi:hypothetical protein